jgi:diguanylate cyclase (GGDEF)-like protein
MRYSHDLAGGTIDDRRPSTRAPRLARSERGVLTSLLATAGVGALASLGCLVALGLRGPSEWFGLGLAAPLLLGLALGIAQGRLSPRGAYRFLAALSATVLLVLQTKGLLSAGDADTARAALLWLPALAPFVYVLAFHGWRAEIALACSATFVALASVLPAVLVSLGLAPSPGAQPLLRFFLMFSVGHSLLVGLVLLFARHERSAAAARATIEGLGRQVRTDPLTGALNRRGLIELLWEEAERSGDRECRLALIFVDLDHFKRVNDRWGHPTGDQVLHGFAALLTRLVRTSDVVGRWGGEEFVVLMRRPTRGEALFLADRLRRAVEEHPFPGVGPITASFGVAGLGPGQSVTEVIAAADEALYQAKAQGRNRTCASRAMMEELTAAGSA